MVTKLKESTQIRDELLKVPVEGLGTPETEKLKQDLFKVYTMKEYFKEDKNELDDSLHAHK